MRPHLFGDSSGQKTRVGKELHALARRMRDRLDDYPRFAHDQYRHPFHNAAEREVRMVKLRQKMSGSMRTLVDAQQFWRSDPTWPPPLSTASTNSTRPPASSRAAPGRRKPADHLISYLFLCHRLDC